MKKMNMLLLLLFYTAMGMAQQKVTTFKIAGHTLELVGEFGAFQSEVKIETIEEDFGIATITLQHKTSAVPPPFSLKWKLPSSNIAGYWSTGAFQDKTIGPSWGPSRERSMLAKQAPVITLFGHDDRNRLTFAVSEALNTVVLRTGVKEEDGFIYNEISFFSEENNPVSTYQVQVRLDARKIHYATALNQVSDWWASFSNLQPVMVPEVARRPVYSSWYSYHQNVSMDALVAECKQAKKMGYASIIVDDGWQTLDSNRGYAFTGDWEPERIPEMKEFVAAVHALDMQFILWYGVPFVGEKSKAYEKMKGKFLRYWNGQGTYVLDPRYPEVREFIINTYIQATKEWDLDGFKLDFIGRFVADKNTVFTAEDGRDYASVNEATDVLMTDLVQSLQKIKPEIMIEFRQPYIGPAMRKYGNMFRAADCPNLPIINRIRTTDLKMLSGNTAVHSDMLMWHYEEPVSIAALQFLNVLYTVPQISVRLEDIPKDHFKMIKFYTDYWLQNRSVLLDGAFVPHAPLHNYPILESSKEGKQITTVFSDQIVSIKNGAQDKIDLWNAKTTEKIIVEISGETQKYTMTVLDCMGKVHNKEIITLAEGTLALKVPVSGLITLETLKSVDR